MATLGNPSPAAPVAANLAMQAIADPAPRTALKLFLRNPVAMAGSLILALILLCALLAPVLFDHEAQDMVAAPLLWPGENPAFPLGTDALGRDLAAGLAYGARVSLTVGFAATMICLVLGLVVGAVAGYFGGLTDEILSRLIEFFQTIPNFLLIIVLVAILGPSLVTITGAIGFVSWPTIARLVRSEFRSLRSRDFVLAARSIGCGPMRIMFLEILPNALPSIIVTGSVMVASAILSESALSFMGLGDPNLISWGSMIGTGRDYLRSAWFLTAVPGLAIVFTVLALNLLGDGLNDALNPRARDR